MDKKRVVLDAVKKLIALKVPEQEIILNLAEVGISTDEAKTLIQDAKRQPVPKTEEKKIQEDSGEAMMEIAERLEKAKDATPPAIKMAGPSAPGMSNEDVDNLTKDFPAEEKQEKPLEEQLFDEEPKRSPIILEKKLKRRIKNFHQKSVAAHTSTKTSLDRLWEKGILTTINQKLNEMKALKENLNKEMAKQVDDALAGELEKIRISFESQRVLMVSQVEDKLDEKFKEATFFIDKKVEEIKTAKQDLKDVSKIIDDERKKQREFLSDYQKKISDLTETKNNLLAELNSEIIKSKSGMQTVIDEGEQKIKSVDDRVNKTLELQSNIAEGMMNDAEDTISKMVDEKSSEIKFEVEKAVASVRTLKTELEQTQKQKIDQFEKSHSEEQQKLVENEAQKIKEMRQNFEQQLNEKLERLDKLYELLEQQVKKTKK